MEATATVWNTDSICFRPPTLDARSIARDVYERTCRTTFDAPGFCLVNVGESTESVTFRQLMIEIKQEMASILLSRTNQTLAYLSAARFDQQESTKPHLDGGPEECLLMLGYEPSEVLSELEISDYTKCAADLGLSPTEFLAKHNPMFKAGADLIQPYVTKIPCFDNRSFQIVSINNSCAPYSEGGERWQGVLHTARILAPDETRRRVINSTMIARSPLGTDDLVSEASLQEFVRTSEVKRRGYDKRHLQDDK